MTKPEGYDVVVIGCGFAGLTAARELTRRGLAVVLLEARDRIGGRTWTDRRFGIQLELGGTWVHWTQPHTWAEITRYGLTIEPSPQPETVYWRSTGQVHRTTPAGYADYLARGQDLLLTDTRRYFPRPYEPLYNDEIAGIDGLTVADRLTAAGLAGEELDLQIGAWEEHFNAPAELCALTQAMRWCAAAGSQQLMDEATSSYRLVEGTAALARAILADSAAELRLNTRARRVEHAGSEVVVHTDDGARFAGRALVAAVGSNVLAGIEFRPQLPETVRAACAQGSASRGLKTWIRVRGRLAPFVAYGGRSALLTFVRTEYFDDDTTTLVAFGPQAARLEPNDLAGIAQALTFWRDDLDVVEVTGHDWVGDEFSRATWPMQQPGQLTGSLSALQRPIGRVYLASSDYANGWAGFIDGAIESGLTAARRVYRELCPRATAG